MSQNGASVCLSIRARIAWLATSALESKKERESERRREKERKEAEAEESMQKKQPTLQASSPIASRDHVSSRTSGSWTQGVERRRLSVSSTGGLNAPA